MHHKVNSAHKYTYFLWNGTSATDWKPWPRPLWIILANLHQQSSHYTKNDFCSRDEKGTQEMIHILKGPSSFWTDGGVSYKNNWQDCEKSRVVMLEMDCIESVANLWVMLSDYQDGMHFMLHWKEFLLLQREVLGVIKNVVPSWIGLLITSRAKRQHRPIVGGIWTTVKEVICFFCWCPI